MTIFKCTNCNKILLPADRFAGECRGISECTECIFHEVNGTRNIKEYNEWLREEK